LKIIAVVVLYKTKPSESETVNSILKIAEQNEHIFDDYQFILYDNGPHKAEVYPEMFCYHFDEMNGGLNTAYNFALKNANESGAQWLLLLDQDTALTAKLFLEQKKVIGQLPEDIVSVVPKLVDGGKVISPAHIKGSIRQKPTKIDYVGALCDCTALNSGSLVCVNFLNSMCGGFCKDFKLDMLDHWLYHEIAFQKKQIYILDSRLEHNLSVSNFKDKITPERYRSILESEYKFYSKYKGATALKKYKCKLRLRALKQQLLFKDKTYAKISWEALKNIKREDI